MNNKGLIGALGALVAVIALAAIGYGMLGAGKGTTIDLSSSATTQASSAAETQSSASGAQTETASSSDEASNSEAAPITLPDFSFSTLDGQTARVSDFAGKPTLLGFWATWCPPCNSEAPELQKLYEKYGDQVNFVMVDSASDGRDTVEGTKKWLDAGGYTYPVYIDETGEAAYAAQIYYLPTMIVLDKDGNMLTAFSGALDEKSGTDLIEQLLAL